MKYKFLEHTADVKFLAEGKTLEKVFENAAEALNETIKGKIKITARIKKKVKVSGKDLENLLYNFLEELLFLLDAENFLFSKIKKIRIEKNKQKFKLEAKILGDLAENYKFTNEVKAVTYNEMFVKRVRDKGKEKFILQVVLDV